ncbi:hypothetical protein K0M31_013727 [Melipona bicolor]|uniref:Uncharacterized protein n=1 Tax=Melipona bicolor TaxID=60889 RepID=A0AA40FH46_9HYME|nr:hypothetical protein K0M31_013727 [Melipona bicolor]
MMVERETNRTGDIYLWQNVDDDYSRVEKAFHNVATEYLDEHVRVVVNQVPKMQIDSDISNISKQIFHFNSFKNLRQMRKTLKFRVLGLIM